MLDAPILWLVAPVVAETIAVDEDDVADDVVDVDVDDVDDDVIMFVIVTFIVEGLEDDCEVKSSFRCGKSEAEEVVELIEDPETRTKDKILRQGQETRSSDKDKRQGQESRTRDRILRG